MASVTKIPTTVTVGQSLIINGHCNKADTFTINLATGPTANSDIIFHMSCRLGKKTYVLNTKRNGNWGEEEIHKCGLEKGKDFSIRIQCRETSFGCFVDGKEMCEYQYRAPLEAITHLEIDGDIMMKGITSDYAVPLRVRIPGNFGPGRKLHLTFLPDDDLYVNFMVNEDIAFHFNPRFHKKLTVNNSQIAGAWGSEEHITKFPFVKKKSTDVVFTCDHQQFSVQVNGEAYCTFNHRVDPKSINTLYVQGKMELQQVKFD